MPNQVLLKRFKDCGSATPGALYIDGKHICFTIENTEKIFPAGGYVLRLTTTGRTMPNEYRGVAYEVLPVEGRTHIKSHVANFHYQLEGCFSPNMHVGKDIKEDAEVYGSSSKPATKLFMDAMKTESGALADNVPLWVVEV